MGELKERAEAAKDMLGKIHVSEGSTTHDLTCVMIGNSLQLIVDMAAEIERLSEAVQESRTMIQMQGRAIRDRYEPRE